MRPLSAWARPDLRRTSFYLLGAAALWLVLPPPPLPIVSNIFELMALRRERSELFERVARAEEANQVLRARFLAAQGREPFLLECLSREAGLLRPEEFDYFLVAAALRAPNPPCPPPPPSSK